MLTRTKDGTIVIATDDYLNLGLDDVVKLIHTVQTYTNKSFKVLIDLSKGYINLSLEALNYLKSHSVHGNIEGIAFCLKSLPNRLLANSFIKKNTFQYAVKVFEVEQEAFLWLEQSGKACRKNSNKLFQVIFDVLQAIELGFPYNF